MVDVKVVINDTKNGRSYQKPYSNERLIGKKIGDKIEGTIVGLQGYELELTGGSDKAGFAMRKDVEGSSRKKILIGKGVGLRKIANDVRRKKSVVGNMIGENTAQVNLKVVKYGTKDVKELLGIKDEPKKEEKKEVKEEKSKEEKPKVEEKKVEEKKETSKEEVKTEVKDKVKEDKKE